MPTAASNTPDRTSRSATRARPRGRAKLRRSLAHLALFATVVSLAGFDWFVEPLSADESQARNGPDVAPPTTVARARDLWATFSSNARIGSVECSVVPTARGLRLEAYNDGRAPERIAMRIERTEMVGSEMSRMGPIPRVVASQEVTLTVAAGARVSQMLASSLSPGERGAPGPVPAQPAPVVAQAGGPNAMPLLVMGGFRTVELRITPIGRADTTTRVVLRLAHRQGGGSDRAAM